MNILHLINLKPQNDIEVVRNVEDYYHLEVSLLGIPLLHGHTHLSLSYAAIQVWVFIAWSISHSCLSLWCSMGKFGRRRIDIFLIYSRK